MIPILLLAGILYVTIRGEGVPKPKDTLGLANYYLKRWVL
jgi:hypothetical protein